MIATIPCPRHKPGCAPSAAEHCFPAGESRKGVSYGVQQHFCLSHGHGHLYSANYGDIIWDYLPRDLQERTPREFYINYNHEATLGETLRLVGFRNEDGSYLMEAIGPDATCFTALCVF